MSDFEFSFPVWLLFSSTAFSLAIAAFIFTRRRAPGSIALGALAIFIAEWAFTYGMEIAAPTLALKIFWGQLEYIGIAFIPFSWLLFSIFYTRPARISKRLFYVHLLGIFPLITAALALSNDWHGLIWRETFLKPTGAITVLGVQYGLWFWIHFAVSYVFLLGGTIIVLSGLRRMKGLYRAQIVALFFAVILPWIGNIVYFTTPVAVDPTPFAFNATLGLLVWAIFGYRLVDIAPIARDLIVDGMREGLIVLDMQGRIVDINARAARFIGLKPAQVIGQPAVEILKPWQSLLEQFRDVLEASNVIQVGSGEAVRELEVRIGPLYDERANLVGRLITFWETDVTESARPAFRFDEPLSEPLPRLTDVSPALPADNANSFWQGVRNFFLPAAIDIDTSQVENPIWAQTIERGITVSARFVMIFGSLAAWSIFFGINSRADAVYAVVVLLFLVSVYFLALVRGASFAIRVRIFVVLIYAVALSEMLKHGFSADVFVYFVALIVLSHLLLNVRGGFVMLALAVVTMVTFAWAVLSGIFVPLETTNTGGIILPVGLSSATTNILGYLFSSLTMMTVVNMFIVNLNQAWKKEVQALNLVQQERNLLEQRVRERTADLAEARDLAVQNSNELRKYFQAIEQSGTSIIITNLQGEIEYVNPYFEQITGYSLAEALGQNPRFLNSGNQDPQFYKELWQSITGGQVWRGELQNKRKDGSLFWEAATIAPVQNHEGKTINYVAIKEDISVQKELRQQIERQNEYLVALQTITLDLLNRRNLDDLLNAVVERACALMDVSLGLIALRNDEGNFIFRATTPAQAHMLGQPVLADRMKYTAKTIETGKSVIVNNYSEVELPYKVGESGYLQATADFPIIVNGEVIGVLALGRTRENYPFSPAQIETAPLFAQMVSLVLDNANLYDSALQEIEQRRQAEKLLQESETRFRQIVETASDIIYRTDTDGRFTYINPTAANTTGFKKESDALGTSCFDLAKPEWRQVLKRFYVRQFLRGEQNTYFEFEAFTQDGREIWIGQNVQLIREREQITGFQAVARDITKLKQAQEALALARDQALEANRFKSQMLAKISHELRTPLGAVIGYSELLQNNLFGPLNNEQREAADNIVDSANYLNLMIGELLDQAQIEARSVRIQNAPFLPRDLMEKVLNTMTILAEKKGLALKTFISDNLPDKLIGDSKRLQQILINLTGNAIKFTIAGEIKIEFMPYESGYWAMRVSDTGAGIPKEAQEYIFEPFRQVDNAITHYNRGTGLGLSITKQLAELMGGQIKLESELDKGSTFTVILPLQQG